MAFLLLLIIWIAVLVQVLRWARKNEHSANHRRRALAGLGYLVFIGLVLLLVLLLWGAASLDLNTH